MKQFAVLAFFLLIALTGTAQVSLSFDPQKEVYVIGDVVELTVRSTSTFNSRAWVAIFKTGVPDNAFSDYIEYHYTGASTSADMRFTIPDEAGQYEFRVYDNDPGRVLKRVPFSVRGIDPREIGLAILDEELMPLKEFKVQLTTELKFNPQAWLGIFRPETAVDATSSYVSYRYAASAQDGVYTMSTPAEAGDYELRFYNADPGVMVKRMPFRVGPIDLPGIGFELSEDELGPEQDLIITYTGHADLTNKAWFGIFPDDAEAGRFEDYLDYKYIWNKEQGEVFFKTPPEKGEYQIRMFYADYGPMLLEPVPFTVTSSLDKTYLEEELDKEGKIALYGIYFDTNKSTVKAESYPLVAEIAGLLKTNPDLRLRIEGHTDSQGEEAYNQSLSERRSIAIRDLLVNEHGIAADRLETIGHGESKPVGNNATAEGRAKNRRVELVKW